MISFKAKFINYGYVQTLDTNNKKKRQKVAFVELDPKYYKDFNAVNKVVGSWGFNAPIGQHIRKSMEERNDEFVYYDEQFFALTEQRDSFLSLEPSKILGLIQMNKDTYSDDGMKIEYLQVRPDCCGSHNMKKNVYNAGKRILKYIEKIFKNSDIYVASAPGAVDFYKKCGYEVCGCLAGTDLVKRRKLL